MHIALHIYPFSVCGIIIVSNNKVQSSKFISALPFLGWQTQPQNKVQTPDNHSIGLNCPVISGTVTDFIGPSSIPDSFIIVPEVEERRAIKPLVAQMLASLGVYGGIIRLAACPKRFVVSGRTYFGIKIAISVFVY